MKLTTLKAATTAALIGLFAHATAQAAPQARIIGGVDIDISYFPSIVALLDTADLETSGSLNRAQFCGGTLIAPTWVLTAAHCLLNGKNTEMSPAQVSILAGSSDLFAPTTLTTAAKRIIIHQQFSLFTYDNDIALIELQAPAPTPAVPMATTRGSANELAFIVGWGATQYFNEEAAEKASFLKAAVVQTQSPTACASLNGLYDMFDPKSQICAGYPEGGVDSCNGDSGGPLYTAAKDETLQLAGITSWGDGCALANKPGIYTDVVTFQGWINDSMRSIATVPDTKPVTGDGSGAGEEKEIQVDIEQSTIGGFASRTGTSGTGASIAFMPLLMLLLCLRFKPFVLFRD